MVPRLQYGLALIDLAVALIATTLLCNNHARLQEVADTIANINEALGFNDVGVYLAGKSINPTYSRRYWIGWYILTVIAALLGVFAVLIRG